MMDFTTSKSYRLELNNSGAWKLLLKFDPTNAQAMFVLDRADRLARSVHKMAELAGEKTAHFALRVSTDESYPQVTMRWEPGHGWLMCK